MFKSTQDIDGVFETPEKSNVKPKKKKRKCTPQQLENLRKAREKARLNRERKKREKQEASNKQVPVKSEPVKSEPVKSEPVKSEPVNAPVKSEPVKSTETPQRSDIKVIRKKASNLNDFMRSEMLAGNNPFNINMTEIIKHQMTLDYQSRINKNNLRRKVLARQQVSKNKKRLNRQSNPTPKPQSKAQPVKNINEEVKKEPRRPYKKNDFFGGLF